MAAQPAHPADGLARGASDSECDTLRSRRRMRSSLGRPIIVQSYEYLTGIDTLNTVTILVGSQDQHTKGLIMARAPFQIFVLPFRIVGRERFEYALFKRRDAADWQGIAGGGEDSETPLVAAKREAFEEARIPPSCGLFGSRIRIIQ